MTVKEFIVEALDSPQHLDSNMSVEIGDDEFELSEVKFPRYSQRVVFQVDATKEVIAEAVGAEMREK